MVETFGTGVVADETIEQLVREHFDLRPAAIIHDLDLRRPIYRQTAAYGHFGRNDIDLPWERTDKVEALQAAAGVSSLVEHARLGGSAFQVHRNHRAASERGRPYSSFKPKFAGRVQRRIVDIDSHGHDFDLADLEGTELHIPERLQRLDDRK